MDITINARHSTVPESLVNQATQRFQQMKRVDLRLTAARLLFDRDAGRCSAEARLAVAGGPPLVAHASGATFRTAMDVALTRLDRQLKRQRDRVVGRRSRGAIEPPPLELSTAELSA